MLRWYFVQEGVKMAPANPQHLLRPCSQGLNADTGSSPQAFPYVHIWTSSEITCCQPPSQGIVSKPTPIEKPSLSRISVGYLHLQQSILKLSTGWFETRDNDRRRDRSYPKVVLYLMKQGLHLESIIFRCPVHLPQRGDSASKFFVLDPQTETLS